MGVAFFLLDHFVGPVVESGFPVSFVSLLFAVGVVEGGGGGAFF